MTRGIYAAANGMVAQQFVLDAVANNMANINTTGFKQDIPTFRELHALAASRYTGAPTQPGRAVGQLGTGSAFDSTAVDARIGALVRTGAPMDIAIAGDGYFSLQTPNGVLYSRDGHFHRVGGANGPGSLVADDAGNLLMGAKGPIDVGKAAAVAIETDGSVMADGVVVDKLALVTAPAASLRKQGANLFSFGVTAVPAAAEIRQGFLEQSNVDPIRSMVRMITVQRAYEAMQKAIVAQDDSLAKAATEVGKT